MILILVGIMMASCRERQYKPESNNESPNEIVDDEISNPIKLIERSEFINNIGRVMVVEIQEHYYIILSGDRGHPIHAESCPKLH